MIIRGHLRSPVSLLHRDNIDIRVTPTIMGSIGSGWSVEVPVFGSKPLFGVGLGEFDSHGEMSERQYSRIAVMSASRLVVWLWLQV